MRALVQRVKASWVVVDGKEVGKIERGLNILLGIRVGDTEEKANKLVEKVLHLRIFEDELGRFQYSLLDVGGSALVVSQFTLYANTQKGRRPSFEEAEKPERAKQLYEYFVKKLSEYVPVQTGIFGAHMEVFILNDGPVTILLEA
ncbi:D-aminoacyl-tRNA deacylase [Thermocrinis sp.]|uniref:D-aminoacyl-tRNA deacylase n=1 Tax=Thermocrinis sp. TaxID=2024383 RepID=UPI002FDEFA29